MSNECNSLTSWHKIIPSIIFDWLILLFLLIKFALSFNLYSRMYNSISSKSSSFFLFTPFLLKSCFSLHT